MNEEFDIKTVPFITNIPQSTISLKIIATIYVDGELSQAETIIDDAGDIREGMLRGDEWDSENTKYVLRKEFMND